MRRWFVIGISAFACLPEPKMGSQERDTRAEEADMEREPGEDAGGPYADARLDAAWAKDGTVADDFAVLDRAEAQDEALSRDVLSADVTDVETADTQVQPGTLFHFGWFGPGGVVGGSGMKGLGSLSGPQQAWQVK